MDESLASFACSLEACSYSWKLVRMKDVQEKRGKERERSIPE
jgi:hypothetical protein